MWLQEIRLEIRKKYNKEDEKVPVRKSVKMKLSKLVLTKFDGAALDWFRFWKHFETDVDKQVITPETKFAFLEEFLISHVRKSMEGLPFTSEGYARAKSIL